MKIAMRVGTVFVLAALILSGCGKAKPVEVKVLASFPADNLNGVISSTGVEADPRVSSDGNGSIKLTVSTPETVVFNLYEVTGLDVEEARLIYRAKVRTQGIQGKAYLEMWVEVPGLGQFFSRGLDQPLRGTSDWVTLETPFLLEKGQRADLAKLNLVIDGPGTAWIDEIELLQSPL